MSVSIWVPVVALLLLALASGVADWRRRRRDDPDRIGWVDWPTVQVLAILGAAMLVAFAIGG